MPGRLFEIRYPNGDFEMSAFTQQRPPEIGETLRRKGKLWRVVSKTTYEPFVVQVEAVPDRGTTVARRHATGVVSAVMADEDATAPQSILRLRFPDGDVEIRWTDKELPVGVLVRSRGAVWVVKESRDASVMLEPAPPEVQSQHGPVVKPDALGEESVFLETIAQV